MINKKLIDMLVRPFLKGEDLDIVFSLLLGFVIRHNQNATTLFNHYLEEVHQDLILQKLLGTNRLDEIVNHKKEYRQWRTTLNISNSLLHFLEFLAQRDSHRIRYFVKEIYQTDAPIKYQNAYLFLAITVAGAGIYFAQNEAAWIALLTWIKETLPSLAIKALDIALQPQNLSFIILIYQSIKYFLDVYYILQNNATSKNHKLKKILRITLTNLLNITGQLINFLFSYLSSTAACLFIASGLIDMLWGLSEYHSLKPAAEPPNNEGMTITELSRGYEAYYYYLKKRKQFQIECMALSVTFVASLVSILLGAQVLCLGSICAVLQFFISLTKNHYNQSYEHHYAIELQSNIKQFYQTTSSTLERGESRLNHSLSF